MLLLLGLLSVIAYGNSIHNSFLWDDHVLVTNNNYIRNHHYLPMVFRSDLFHNDFGSAARYYRPIQTVTYMADYALWGLNPDGYHLTNLFLQLACVLLLALLLEQLAANRLVAFIVAGLFAVHPVLTNAVTYIAGRADSLAFFGMLAAWLLWLRRRPLFFVASALCYVLALCSRENAFLFPLLIVLHSRLLDRNEWHRVLLDALPFALLATAFVFWRNAVLSLGGNVTTVSWSLPWTVRLQIPFRALATYLGLLFWPAHLQMERQVVLGGAWLRVLTTAGVLAVAGLVVLARRNRLACFGVCWFVLTLLPLSGLFSLNATVAEHWLYVPCAGLFLGVVSVVPLGRGAMIMAVAVLTALAARTIVRNTDWRDAITFYERTKTAAPYSAAVRSNLGLELVAAGRTNGALSELRNAERLAPDSIHASDNLAAIYLKQGNLDKAQGKVADALRLDPHNPNALARAAMIWEQRGDVRRARLYYLRALAQTLNVPLRLEYAEFLARQRRLAEALQIAEEACALEPPNANAHNLRGVVLAESSRFDEAQLAFETARKLDRHSPNAAQNLARLRALRDKPHQAASPAAGGASLR
jgi:Flp pilus assembly protein TadD